MPSTRTSVKTFLGQAKSELQTAIKESKPVTFVVGNESADLDSLLSSVIYAYLRTYNSLPRSSNQPYDALYIPLSNLPRPDLALRPELPLVLSHADLVPEDLITLSDLSLSSSAPKPDAKTTSWILVDHNALTGSLLASYAADNNDDAAAARARIRGCIDHHADEHFVPPRPDRVSAPPSPVEDDPRIIATAGSCTSLVVEYFQRAWSTQLEPPPSSLPEQESRYGCDAALAVLALAPILVDTANLTSSKTTPTDRSAVSFLESLLHSSAGSSISTTATPTPYSRNAYFNTIAAAKSAIDDLSLQDILRKDYKSWSCTSTGPAITIGIASIPRNVTFLRDAKAGGSIADLVHAIRRFGTERGVAVLGVMTASGTGDGEGGGGFRRELMLVAINEADGAGDAVVQRFLAKGGVDSLGLEAVDLNGNGSENPIEGVWIWEQRNLEKSRKEVAPLLRAAASASASAEEGAGKGGSESGLKTE